MLRKKYVFIIILILPMLFAASSPAQIIYRLHDKKSIALTFDDGPCAGVTEKILAVLKKEKVKATFFVQGRKVHKRPDLFQKIIAGGNKIGSHTYHHTRLNKISGKRTLIELSQTKSIISRASSKKYSLFRAPHGHVPKDKMKIIEQMGYKIYGWSVCVDDYYKDGVGTPSPKAIAKRVLARVKGGDIILMHDDCENTAKALPKIIHTLRNRGFKFTTL